MSTGNYSIGELEEGSKPFSPHTKMPTLAVDENEGNSGSLCDSSRSNVRASTGDRHQPITVSTAEKIQQESAQAAGHQSGSGSWPPASMNGLMLAASKLGLPLPQPIVSNNSCPETAVNGWAPGSSPGTSTGSGSSAQKAVSKNAIADDGPCDMVDPEYRRMRRRFTNRESAQRVRQKRQQDLHRALGRAEALSKENEMLKQGQAEVAVLVAELQAQCSQWQEAARELAGETWQLKRRLVKAEAQLEVNMMDMRAEASSPPAPVSSDFRTWPGILGSAPSPLELLPLESVPNFRTSADSAGLDLLVHPESVSACISHSTGSHADLGLPVTAAPDLWLSAGLPFDDLGDLLSDIPERFATQ